jgi:hypothetical protein
MNEYSIIVKNTTSFFKISDIDWDTSDNYRLVFENNSHVTIENFTLISQYFIKGTNCRNIKIISSSFSNDMENDPITLENFNHLFIMNSFFNMTGITWGGLYYISQNGTVELHNCYMYRYYIFTHITGTHIIKNSTFMYSHLSPEKMSNNSIISNNYFYYGSLRLLSSREYNYGIIENNTFNKGIGVSIKHTINKDKLIIQYNNFYFCDIGVRINSNHRSINRIFIINNNFNYCVYGINGHDSSNFDVTGNKFYNNSAYSISLSYSYGYKIWKNFFINNGGSNLVEVQHGTRLKENYVYLFHKHSN